MQISKLSVALGLAVLALVALSVRADTDAQQKAREALRQKMNELQSPAAPAAPAVPRAPAAPAAPSAPAAPAAAQAPSAPAVVGGPSAVAPDKIEQARQAVRREIAGGNLGGPAPVAADKIDQAREALRRQISEMDTVKGPTPVAADQIENAREAVREEIATGTPASQWETLPAEVMTGRERAEEEKAYEESRRAAAMRSEPTYVPLRAPALPISGDKQHQLQQLLRRYRADQITPEEYHDARAKILAQP